MRLKRIAAASEKPDSNSYTSTTVTTVHTQSHTTLGVMIGFNPTVRVHTGVARVPPHPLV